MSNSLDPIWGRGAVGGEHIDAHLLLSVELTQVITKNSLKLNKL